MREEFQDRSQIRALKKIRRAQLTVATLIAGGMVMIALLSALPFFPRLFVHIKHLPINLRFIFVVVLCFSSLWSRFALRCPKCGKGFGISGRFCINCGFGGTESGTTIPAAPVFQDDSQLRKAVESARKRLSTLLWLQMGSIVLVVGGFIMFAIFGMVLPRGYGNASNLPFVPLGAIAIGIALSLPLWFAQKKINTCPLCSKAITLSGNRRASRVSMFFHGPIFRPNPLKDVSLCHSCRADLSEYAKLVLK